MTENENKNWHYRCALSAGYRFFYRAKKTGNWNEPDPPMPKDAFGYEQWKKGWDDAIQDMSNDWFN